MWCIPPESNAAFVCNMEAVLDVYKRAVDPEYPVICMDETSTQCIKEVRPVIAAQSGQTERYDAEYERNGVAHLMLFYAPFEDWRRLSVGDNHSAVTWAEGVRRLAEEDFPKAKRITLVMDNLNTHAGASLYKAFPPEQARALLNRFEFVFTPKHGSWLNMAECEFAALSRQCLDRRMPDLNVVKTEIDAWTRERNQRKKAAQWRFTTADARVKLARLYPKNDD